jgi:hypothetical protein
LKVSILLVRITLQQHLVTVIVPSPISEVRVISVPIQCLLADAAQNTKKIAMAMKPGPMARPG